MQFNPIAYTEQALDEYTALFAQCFPGTTHFTRAYLAWLYSANPDGNAVGFDARAEDGTLAAHYVCVPARARVDGQEVLVLLSLNTATHPQFQGKGLFTKLAALTFEAGAAGGFDGVYGVANGNSTPGFIRKLGFQLVRPLEAMVGVGTLGTGAVPPALSFERVWSDQALAWRCSSPVNPVQCRPRGNLWQFHARALKMVPAYAELDRGKGSEAVDSGAPSTPFRLFLGLVPDQARGLGTYASIPKRLRPSPLNLIYRSFSPRVTQLDPALIRFSFLDFDAY
jgi:hypothetical protein